MKKKMLFTLLFSAALACSVIAGRAYSSPNKGGYGYSSEGHHSKGLKEKLFHKAHFIKTNQEALGVTDEQIDKIMMIKRNAKKDLIRKDAEVEVIKIDIHALLWDDPIDVKAVHKLIDQKYDIKRAKAKGLVDSFAALKSTLTADQKAKMTALWKSQSR